MDREARIKALNSALIIVDGLLLDAENSADVKLYSKLYEYIDSVYNTLCLEGIGLGDFVTVPKEPTAEQLDGAVAGVCAEWKPYRKRQAEIIYKKMVEKA